MRNGFKAIRGLRVTFGVAAMVAATSVMNVARGQESVPAAPPGFQVPRPGEIVDMREARNTERRLRSTQLFHEGEDVVFEHRIGGGIDPIASQFLERATKALSAEFGDNVAFRITMPRPGCLLEGVCSGSTCCEQMLDKLVVAPEINEYPLTNFAAKFIRLGCPCTAEGDCHCAAQTSCGSDCAAATSSSCKCCPCAGQSGPVACSGGACEVEELVVKHVNHHSEAAQHDPLSLLKHIAELMAEKAAAQAALEVRKESQERFSELFEAMAEVIADNAALDARLEAQLEQRKLVEKMAELTAENAKLKAHVELAAEKAEIARSTSTITLENERLKLRLADLEHKHAAAEAARTASRPNRERKPR